jgi:CrcB protein
MTRAGLIFLAGGVGSVLRYLLAGWSQRLLTGAFPLGTLVVNLTGCLLIGFLSAAFADRLLIREEYRIALMVGLLGGFTTFSTFGLETFALLNDGQFARAAANVALQAGVGVTAVWLGYRAAQAWIGG